MKKTLIALMAMAGVAAASPTAVYTISDVSLTTAQKYDISGLGLSTASASGGYTMMLTFSNDAAFKANTAGSILWLSTSDIDSIPNNDYQNSTATLGFRTGSGVAAGLALFNAANGSSIASTNDAATGYLEWNGGGISTNNSAFGATTVFLTSEYVSYTLTDGSTSTWSYVSLYELTSSGDLVLTSVNNGLVSGDVSTLMIGNWTNKGTNLTAGSADIALYNSVLTTTQMNQLLVPEPTTATLSLLALAGLAARRRRK